MNSIVLLYLHIYIYIEQKIFRKPKPSSYKNQYRTVCGYGWYYRWLHEYKLWLFSCMLWSTAVFLYLVLISSPQIHFVINFIICIYHYSSIHILLQLSPIPCLLQELTSPIQSLHTLNKHLSVVHCNI